MADRDSSSHDRKDVISESLKETAGAQPDGQEAALTLAGQQLGTTVLEVHGRTVLIPTPSNDPNDPLNWSKVEKIYITGVACIAVLLSNFLAAGPTVDIVKIAMAFTSATAPNVSKTAYFFSASALFQGVGMFIWMPIVNRYGRRPVYVITYIFFSLCVIWAGLETRYAPELIARFGIGLFAGGAEALAPLTINDLFFLHERGAWMCMYQTFLAIGVSIGIILSGLMVQGTGSWRNIYWMGLGFIGTATLLVIFTFPETAYRRTLPDKHHVFASDDSVDKEADPNGGAEFSRVPTAATAGPRKSYLKRLSLYSGTYTDESLWIMFIRPFGLPLLPAVGWSVLLFSSTIGFLVAITSNFAVPLSEAPYNFDTAQSGLVFLAGTIGGLLGIPAGGVFSDWVAARGTHRNGGVREPEHRLPALFPIIILAPLGLVLYGVGFEKKLHWMCPTVGLGLLTFSIVAGTNVAWVYCIDTYKPIAGEVVVAILGWKAVIGFALSFGTNNWIDLVGYLDAFGEMAAISGFFLLMVFPFIFWGAKMRKASWNWWITRWIHWSQDRDDVAIVIH